MSGGDAKIDFQIEPAERTPEFLELWERVEGALEGYDVNTGLNVLVNMVVSLTVEYGSLDRLEKIVTTTIAVARGGFGG